jgi:sugar/nucleoside kinase (ribokinase family)
MPVATIAVVGDDPEGRFLVGEAEAHGIEHTQMAVVSQTPTDYTFAFSALPSGQRTHISYFGTSHLLTPDHFDFSRSRERIFHLGLPGIHNIMDGAWNGDANGWVATLRKARATGLQTNMELASIAPDRLAALVRPCLPHLDYLVVNDHEIAGITGISTARDGKTDPAACATAARAALEIGTMGMVAVHFPQGGVVVLRDGTEISRPSVQVPPSEIAGANGAGDAFAAGLIYAIHEGWSAEDALQLAHAVAAASLREISTTASIEPWSDCLALASRWGWREAFG